MGWERDGGLGFGKRGKGLNFLSSGAGGGESQSVDILESPRNGSKAPGNCSKILNSWEQQDEGKEREEKF